MQNADDLDYKLIFNAKPLHICAQFYSFLKSLHCYAVLSFANLMDSFCYFRNSYIPCFHIKNKHLKFENVITTCLTLCDENRRSACHDWFSEKYFGYESFKTWRIRGRMWSHMQWTLSGNLLGGIVNWSCAAWSVG